MGWKKEKVGRECLFIRRSGKKPISFISKWPVRPWSGQPVLTFQFNANKLHKLAKQIKFMVCFCLILRYKAFLTVLVNRCAHIFIYFFWRGDLQRAHSPRHSFPLRNDLSHAESRNKIKRDLGRHILNDLNFYMYIKRRENLKRPILPSFENGTDKKCQWMYATHSGHKQREIFNHTLEGKKSSIGLNFNK